jgi:hypothetical protein
MTTALTVATGEDELRKDPMMAHLMRSLEEGRDIGHYGRLCFAIIAHWFLDHDRIVDWLRRDDSFSEEDAEALWRQVEEHEYNPPRRDKILQWQALQSFPIVPDPKNADCGNVYRTLQFPDEVYERIKEFYRD